jgi:hypothetical protein
MVFDDIDPPSALQWELVASRSPGVSRVCTGSVDELLKLMPLVRELKRRRCNPP